MNTKVTKVISGILSVTLFSTTLTCFPVIAEDADKYPYTMFAGSSEEGAITINASNVCINGNIATNGTIVSSGNMNVNGSKTENAAEEMMFILEKLDSAYFSGSNVEFYTEDYSYEETNINISNPLEVEGDLELTGNINLSTGIKALEDVNLNGDVKNTNESVICSETGDIIINTNNVNLNGLVYAPEGCVDITAQNLNMNNVIIIADTIKVECPNLNANYSTSMGEFVGTESEVDLELFAFGEYISESNSINVFWDTTIPKGTFDVQTSYDNETYTSVVTVTDVESYNYAISEEFEEMYIKVTETTYYGEICETVPFVVTKSKDGYTIDYLDSDEDGLPDIFETEIGTKIDISDSDEDGLTDYQEIYFTDTDPTIYSSVTEGIRDADIDSDSDGLSNIFELEYEIDPLLEDTDEDSLSDYDEIYVYITLPALPDTDEDSIDDGSEIKLGLDPNNPETFGYPDAEYSIEQQIETDSPVMSEVNTEENAYGFSIEMKTNGYAEDVISVSESEYAAAIENEAMLGISTDIEIDSSCNAENIVLKYTIKDEYLDNTLGTYADCEELQGIKRLNVFKYFDELNMLLPIETQFDVDNNLIYTEVDELGTYCVMDMEIWLDMLGVESVEEIEEEIALSEVQLEYDSPVVLSNEITYTYGNYIYTLKSDGTASIIKYNGSDSELIIPAKINGHIVTTIGSSAFSFNKTLVKISIPDSVITIDEFAFYMTGLTSLVIPNSVEYIGAHAFGVCNDLITVNISASVKTISDAAFDLCKNLMEINVNDNNPYYLSIDGVVYSKNQNQLVFYPPAKDGASFTVPDHVTIIRTRAFTYNQKLTDITLSSNVSNIMNDAFVACEKLVNIYVNEENTSFISINGVLFNKKKTAIIRYPQAKNNSTFTIPDGVTGISRYAFYSCHNLVKVNIPDSVTTIGEDAFNNCSALSEIIIPNSVTKIGSSAFSSCKSLTKITIPDSITSIEIATFSSCSNLTTIIIPESVQGIAVDAFSGCNKLTIYGYTGSYAEEYANINNIKFVSIGSQEASFEALVGTKWKKIKLDGILNANNGINSDTDSLTDWQEVNTNLLKLNNDGSYELPTLMETLEYSDLLSILDAMVRWKGTPYEYPIGNIWNHKVLPILSDPTEEDSDGDEFVDDIDPNRLLSDVKVHKLEHDEYLRIEREGQIYYGSNQSWFSDLADDKYFNSLIDTERVPSKGCGLIATADTITYLNIYKDLVFEEFANEIGCNTTITATPDGKHMTDILNHIQYDYETDIIKYEKYMDFMSLLLNSGKLKIYENDMITGVVGGYLPLSIKSLFNKVFNSCDLPYKATWAFNNSENVLQERIEEMLDNNIPVIISYDDTEIYENLPLYEKNANSYYIQSSTQSHYMVITELIEYSDNVSNINGNHKKMIKVSTWGKVKYVDLEEYCRLVDKGALISDVTSNILYIEEEK